MTNRKPSLPHRKHLDRQDCIFLFLHVQLQFTIMSPEGGALLPLSDCIFWKKRKTRCVGTCERTPTLIPGRTGNVSSLSPVLSEQDWGTKDQEPRTRNSTSAVLSEHNQWLRNTEHSPNRPLQGKNFMESCKAGATLCCTIHHSKPYQQIFRMCQTRSQTTAM